MISLSWTSHSEFLLLTLFGLNTICLPRDVNCLPSTGIRVSDDYQAKNVHTQDVRTGTTYTIKQIVIGRCWTYQRQVTGTAVALPSSQVDCDNVAWPAFIDAFAYKDPCSIPDDAYTNFIRLMTVRLPINSTLFWSGTKNLATTYADQSDGRLFILETTFLGYTVNNLEWCGTSTGGVDGIDYDTCPEYGAATCPDMVTEVFWGTASVAFARQAHGSVTVLLNGSDPRGAFRNTSFFATKELANLNASRVQSVHIIVAHDPNGEIIDTCNTGTVLTLKNRIVARGLRWSCEDDPRLVTLIQCIKKPESKGCGFTSGTEWNQSYDFAVILMAMPALIINFPR